MLSRFSGEDLFAAAHYMTAAAYRMLRRGLAAFVLLCCAVTAPVRGACRSTAATSPQRWSFTTMEWTYSGTFSTTGIAGAASAWNAKQSFSTIQSSTFWNDIGITDSSAVTGLAESQTYNYGNGSSPCYLKRSSSCSSICFNTSRVYFADIRLNPSNIAGAASDWGYTVNNVVQGVISHEIGHIFWLDHPSDMTTNCTDPTIMSVNDHFYCALTGPTACDGSEVGSVYLGWNTVSNSTCGTCNLNTSCSN